MNNANNSKTLVFVYNAESNWLNKVTDFAHKAIKPQTYQCDLCSLTHGVFKERKQWTNFLKSIDYNTEFYYKNKYDNSKDTHEPPCIILKEDNCSKLLFSNSELSKFKNINEFVAEFKVRLNEIHTQNR